MNTLEAVLERYKLELNINKTQFIANYDGNLTYQGNQITRTQKYKYLGKLIEQGLTHGQHMTN